MKWQKPDAMGEVIYGGLGIGLSSMMVSVLVSVFIGGLMVNHTSQYLGKQLTISETKLLSHYMVIGGTTVMLLNMLTVLTGAVR